MSPADFDPDAYLASKGAAEAFDPDAYLASKGPALGMGDVQAARSAQPETLLQQTAHALPGALGKLWGMVKPGQYASAPAGPSRQPGEADAAYAARAGHEGIRELGSPEGIGRGIAMMGYTLPGAAAERPPNSTLGGMAETAAIRSSNADRTAFRKAFKNDPAKMHESGRFLLDENVPLRSPQAMREGLQSIKAEEGPAIGALTQQADQAGARFDLQGAADAAMNSRDVAQLAKNTEHRDLHARVGAFLQDQIAQHGADVPASVAHDIRQQVDSLANWDQTKTKEAVDAWRAVRGAVNDEMGATMDRAGLGDAWAASNGRFKNASRVEGLAKIGAERREGNRWGSPSEKAAGIAGGMAAAMHNPVAGVALPAATVALNRYGMPVAARSLDFAARNMLPGSPSAGSEAAALANALRRHLTLPAPTLAGEGDQR